VLLSIAGGSDLGLFEINEAAALVSQAAHNEANIIFGATIDDALGDEVRVTVIAAGFDGGMPKRRQEGNVLRQGGQPAPAQTQEQTRAAAQQVAAQRVQQAQQAQPTLRQPAQPQQQPAQAQPQQPQPAQTQQQPGQQSGQQPAQSRPQQERPRPTRQVQFDDDDLDVPDFLK
jgi:cell division protein FtsZ